MDRLTITDDEKQLHENKDLGVTVPGFFNKDAESS